GGSIALAESGDRGELCLKKVLFQTIEYLDGEGGGEENGKTAEPSSAVSGTFTFRKVKLCFRLAEEGQHVLRYLVGLRQNRSPGLLQDLRAGHVAYLRGIVRVLDARARGR